MAPQERELHERFIRGITAKMLGLGALGLISVVSSFWIGYNNLKDEIKDSRVQSKENLSAFAYSIKRSQDSMQHINELQIQAIWSEIKGTKDDTQPKRATSYFSQKYLNGRIIPVPPIAETRIR